MSANLKNSYFLSTNLNLRGTLPTLYSNPLSVISDLVQSLRVETTKGVTWRFSIIKSRPLQSSPLFSLRHFAASPATIYVVSRRTLCIKSKPSRRALFSSSRVNLGVDNSVDNLDCSPFVPLVGSDFSRDFSFLPFDLFFIT